MSRLENADITFNISHPEKMPPVDIKAQRIKKTLRELDLNKCTPIEAFGILADLAEQAKED